ncbi:uncharacterized protein CDAR_9101 [Caerostris darwini]|uniref:Uncharacterized protein n=1 Tax=Caerostris darwini TaxID=1538125 RepID=A0AAV4UY94_9ARAC|nr:uncharacterized protein CDAR_9101 [Caerostris darwini]
MHIITAVKLVVIKDDSNSKSEESVEKMSSSESKEIDMLMDIIDKEARAHREAPVKSVHLVKKRRPNIELVPQHSTRSEQLHHQAKLAKEYHVHYHNHQHGSVENPGLRVNEDKLTPLLWQSVSSQLNPPQNLYTSSRTPSMPLMILPGAADRFKDFKDFESLLQPKKQTPAKSSSKYVFQDSSQDDDETLTETFAPKHNKTVNDKRFELLRKYQALLNGHTSRSRQKSSKDKFLNQERFAGFTDFSAIESPPSQEEVENPKNPENDEMVIKDFAIVIKTKNRPPPNSKKNIKNTEDQRYHQKPRNAQIKSRVPQETRENHALRLPRILDAPGGSPKFIDKLNRLKYASQFEESNIALRNALFHNLNSIESQHHARFHYKPVPRPHLNSHIYNGWLIQRMPR